VVRDARGSLNSPMSDDDLIGKTTRLCAYAAPGFDPAPAIEAVWKLEQTEDASRILAAWRDARP
jgi:hypothetical protein